LQHGTFDHENILNGPGAIKVLSKINHEKELCDVSSLDSDLTFSRKILEHFPVYLESDMYKRELESLFKKD
jgi:hypothetical protein